MKNKLRLIRLTITVVIVGLFAWFLVLSPYITFKQNENAMVKAAKRYYEINLDKLPTGTRISTVTLQTLSRESYIDKDFYVPFSKKPCSITESWVKVKHTDSGYKYYVYLECGVLKSATDHKGPTITLNGKDEITINKDEKYEEPGVKKVVDNTDGKMDVKDVTIDSSKVDTSKVGTYKVTYTALDSFKNKTEKVRTVKVVQELEHTIKKDTNNTGVYTGEVENNYIRFSGNLFRIVSVENGNVKIVAAEDVSNVNYSGLDQWLEYYYDHLADSSKEYIVKTKYCNDKVTDTTTKKCSSYTKEKDVYILSVEDVNNSVDTNSGESYLYSSTIVWLANTKTDKESWATRSVFFGTSDKYSSFSKNYNLGIRPVITIKGSNLITLGTGTENDPYQIDDMKTGKPDENLNTRYSGEYIEYSNMLWRIVEVEKSGAIKVISNSNVPIAGEKRISYDSSITNRIYNPNQKGNVGYAINQKVADTIDEKYFDKTEIEVPIYKTTSKYKKETTTKKYKVKFHAPDMYDLYTAQNNSLLSGYWLLNSSQSQDVVYMISPIGAVYNTGVPDSNTAGIRVIGYLNKNCKIVSGKGTEERPYKIAK
ncbi:MAG: DUF5011 domain-containing protein [bacterium]|nr:DUF5011 domain-containing protein [bacterium]